MSLRVPKLKAQKGTLSSGTSPVCLLQVVGVPPPPPDASQQTRYIHPVLGQRRRLLTNIQSTLDQRHVPAGLWLVPPQFN